MTQHKYTCNHVPCEITTDRRVHGRAYQYFTHCKTCRMTWDSHVAFHCPFYYRKMAEPPSGGFGVALVMLMAVVVIVFIIGGGLRHLIGG